METWAADPGDLQGNRHAPGGMLAVMEVEARRISQLAQRAIDQVEETRRAVEGLLAALNGARAGTAPRATPPAPEPPVPAGEAGLDTARLVAIEMAVAGSSREEVGSHLRAAYAPGDLEALLDDFFGTAGERRGAPSSPAL